MCDCAQRAPASVKNAAHAVHPLFVYCAAACLLLPSALLPGCAHARIDCYWTHVVVGVHACHIGCAAPCPLQANMSAAAATADALKLQAALHKLQSQFDEVARERDTIAKGMSSGASALFGLIRIRPERPTVPHRGNSLASLRTRIAADGLFYTTAQPIVLPAKRLVVRGVARWHALTVCAHDYGTNLLTRSNIDATRVPCSSRGKACCYVLCSLRTRRTAELAVVKEHNRRGDAELRKAERTFARAPHLLRTAPVFSTCLTATAAPLDFFLHVAGAVAQSKDAKVLAQMMDEQETYLQQVKALQEMLRTAMNETEKYRKLALEGEAKAASEAATQKELQDRIAALRTEVKDLEKEVAAASGESSHAAPTSAPTAAAGSESTSPVASDSASTTLQANAAISSADVTVEAEGAAASSSTTHADLRTRLADLRSQLAAAEEAAEAGASEAVKATRAREKLERESREHVKMLESALEKKVLEATELQQQCASLEEAHSRDLQVRVLCAWAWVVLGMRKGHVHVVCMPRPPCTRPALAT
ncbi:hypothetical protein EON66_02040 [archaeon]|nr:MAG: hypothetical protein EON66_02040 [archaeon]